MHQDKQPSSEPTAVTYTPSDAAIQAFTKALKSMAMSTYHELADTKKPAYARGFAMGFDGLPFPVEAVSCRAMDDGFMFGTRACHKGPTQGETDRIAYC
jgi:hypothetical protein